MQLGGTGLSGGLGGGLGLAGLGQQQQLGGGLQLGGLPNPSLGAGQVSGLQLGGGLGQTGGVHTPQLLTQGLKLGQSTQPAATSVGQQATGGLQLGQQATGGLRLGQQTQLGGLQMGQQRQLGQTAQTTGGLQLGQPKQTTSGLQLGQQTQPTGGLQLGQQGQVTQGQGLKLPQTLPAPTSSIGLSAPQTTTSLGLTLAKTTTGTTAPNTQLGGLSTSLAAGGGGLKLGTGLPTTTQTTALSGGGGLKLGGLLGPTTSAPGLGGLLGPTTSAPGLGGLGTVSSQPGASGLKLGGGILPPMTTATTSVGSQGTSVKGLGGVDPSTSVGKGTKSGPTSVMDTQLPDPLNQLVASYEQFIKSQKEKSDEISKFSDSGLKKVKQDTVSQEQTLTAVSSRIMKDSQLVGFLKNETSEELMNAEVAQRTQELPAGLQHENTAPDLYFQKLVSTFESKMVLYRREIEELESHLSAIAPDSGLSPQNIVEILQLQYKPFLLLAAQLQTTHEHVQSLKEQYLNYRRVVLQDPTDVFEERRKVASKEKSSDQVPSGPSPFSSTMGQMSTGLTTYPAAVGQPGLSTGLGALGGGLQTGSGFNPSGLSLGTGVVGGGLNLGGLSVGTNAVGTGLRLGSGLGGGLSSMSQPTLSTLGTFSGAGSAPTMVGAAAGGTQPFTLQRPPLGKKRNG